MIGASKILTVSYGTFSCTLEGFDDPFNTMKAIAEYFRDLAAGDRYFGAEPPIPDAAMLHRIAEREIHRRVDAQIQDNGVILRAAEATVAPSTAGHADVEAPAPSDVADFNAPFAAATPRLNDAVAESVAAKLAKLRAREKAAQDRNSTTVSAASVAIGLTNESNENDFAAEETSRSNHAEMPKGTTTDLASLLPLPSQDDGFENEDFPEEYEEVGFASGPEERVDDLLSEDLDSFDIVELVRLDGVASPMESEADVQGDVDSVDLEASEQNHKTAGVEVDGFDIEDAPAGWPNASPVVAPSDLEAQDSDDTLGTDEGDDAARDDNDFDAPEINFDAQNEVYEAIDVEVVSSDDAMLASLGAIFETSEKPSFSAAHAIENVSAPKADADDNEPETEFSYDLQQDFSDEAQFDVEIDLPMDVQSQPEGSVTTTELHGQSSLNSDADDEDASFDAEEPVVVAPVRPRARVIKIRRADAELVTEIQAQQAGQATLDHGDAPRVAPKAEVSALTDEAEAALQAELAALEADLDVGANTLDVDAPAISNASETVAPAIQSDEVAPTRPRRRVRNLGNQLPTHDGNDSADLANQGVDLRKSFGNGNEDAALSRLMAQADNEMDEVGTRRRLSAISHLKAAVAATVAERQIKANQPGGLEIEPRAVYRDDLERAVATNQSPRPTRPTNGVPPLVLVSAQRIDLKRPNAAPVSAPAAVTDSSQPRVIVPVRPRRIAPVQQSFTPSPVQNVSQLGLDPNTLAEIDAEDLENALDDEDENLFADSSSFAEFAEGLGANGLPELLEAAAVYCARSLGRPEFTRPLVLRQVMSMPGNGSISREDCLIQFSTLLRQGRLAKTRRGHFAVTDRSPILAESLKTAG